MGQKAYALWEHDINRRGGLLGRRVQVVVAEDKSDPQTARAIYRRLIVEDKVDLIFGPYSSEITQAVLPITEQYGYPLLASGAAADKLWQQGYKYVFGVYISASQYSVGFLELLVDRRLDDIAVIYADDIFSQNVAVSTKEWAQRFGLRVIFYEKFPKGTKNLDDLIRRAQTSGAQALMVCGHFDESVHARVALKNIGWYPRAYYATVGPVAQRYHDVLKADAYYAFSSSQWEPSSPFPGARAFAEDYRHTYGALPAYQAASAYAAGQILESAVNKIRSIEREKLRQVLSSLDVITIIGRYGVDHTGMQIRHFATTVQWQPNGKKEIVGPKELMTAPPIWR